MNAFKACAATAALLVLGGCAGMRGKGGPVTAAEKESRAEAELCKNMGQGGQAIRNFPKVDVETPLSAVQDARDDAEDAVADVKSALDDVSTANLLEVQSAFNKLRNTVNSIPGGRSTVGDASGTISEEVEDLQIAWDKLYKELQCGA
jgi:hypothetical protein